MTEENLYYSEDEEEMMTICDYCSTEIPLNESNDGGEYGTLCNECYALLAEND